MREVLPDIWHWTTPNPGIGGILVSSYWLDSTGVLIDPLIPEEGIEWFADRPKRPGAIVLDNRHHYRDSGQLCERFGCKVSVPAAGMHEFTDDQPVVPYEPGDILAGDLLAVHVGALSPDDGGLYLESSQALWLADTVVRSPNNPNSQIGWVPDQLMDDPPQTKRRLIEAFTGLLDELEFEHLLLAHGLPLIGDGRAQLEAFVESGGGTATDAF
jgi:hypothetical protein